MMLMLFLIMSIIQPIVVISQQAYYRNLTINGTLKRYMTIVGSGNPYVRFFFVVEYTESAFRIIYDMYFFTRICLCVFR